MYFMIDGVRVRGHESFYAYDLVKIFKKISAKSGVTKACHNQRCKEKKCVFPCPPQLMSLPHKHPTWFPVFPPILLSCSNEMSRREMGMRLKTTDNNIINFVI